MGELTKYDQIEPIYLLQSVVTYCNVFCHWRRKIWRVRGLQSLCVTCLRYWSLLNTKCYVLEYRRRHSVCYFVLFTTSLVVTTMCSDPLTLRLRAVLVPLLWSFDLLCSGLLWSVFYLPRSVIWSDLWSFLWSASIICFSLPKSTPLSKSSRTD
jgi:hypothetical protein